MPKTFMWYVRFCFNIAGAILLWESVRGLINAQTSVKNVLGDFRFYFGLVFLVAVIIMTSLEVKKRK